MSQHQTLSELAAQLCDLILSRDSPTRMGDDEFDAFALKVFSAQFEANAVYRKFCSARDATPETVRTCSGIPAVPTAGFKEFELTCLTGPERIAEFHSSGTTGQKPSRHFHSGESLDLYEASLVTSFRRQLIPNHGRRVPPHLVALTPRLEEAPRSSLVYMFETIRKELGEPASAFLGTAAGAEWALECNRVLDYLAALLNMEGQEALRPVLLLGTAISFLELIDFMLARKQAFRLPPGSRIMETGGYKGRSRAVSREQLHNLLSRQFGVPMAFVISEYGMSELSSQAYAASSGPVRVSTQSNARATLPPQAGQKERQGEAANRRFHFPPWARARLISPETGAEIGEGETGLIQVLDLANVFSVMAVQTEDLGVKRGAGFELLGRASDAEPRGCSLRAVSSR